VTAALVVDLTGIAEACRPMAAWHHAERLGLRPGPDLLEAATTSLAQARHAPGRVGRAIRLILDGPYAPGDLDDALEVVLRVANYAPPEPAKRAPKGAPRRRCAPDPNQLVFSGFSRA